MVRDHLAVGVLVQAFSFGDLKMLVPNVVTMSSLEMVEFINSTRGEGEAVLRHDSFMAKVPKVLGGEVAPKFLGTTFYINGAGAKVERKIYNFPKREACLMAMSYSYELQARVFDRMTELENRQRLDTPPGNYRITEIDIARLAADILNMSESGKLGMVHKLANSCGVNTNFLPAYTVDEPIGHVSVGSSEITHSATALLKKRGLAISTVRFNKELFNAGILEKGKRKNSRGEDKSFWVISDAGLEYGKNITHPDNPREVAPHWYDEKFDDLLTLLRL